MSNTGSVLFHSEFHGHPRCDALVSTYWFCQPSDADAPAFADLDWRADLGNLESSDRCSRGRPMTMCVMPDVRSKKAGVYDYRPRSSPSSPGAKPDASTRCG
jgi:hypothetical protein